LKETSSSSNENVPDGANLDDEIDIIFSFHETMIATFSRVLHDDRHAIPRTGQNNDRTRPLQA
jgi:hypothetical protein